MPLEIHWNKDRGHVEQGWLKSAHSFSFARYVNPDRQRFGALLVLNEDVIQPGEGFGEHFHDNMEIVTIPLSGRLRHQDSLGNGSVIQAGDVQIMSAGTGIMHSEFNDSQADSVHLLQIWIIPNQRQLPTRYEEKRFSSELFHNRFFTVVSPDSSVDRLQIFQQAWFRMGKFDRSMDMNVDLHDPAHGLFVFVIEGSIRSREAILNAGDTLAAWHEKNVLFEVIDSAQILTIEIPMI